MNSQGISGGGEGGGVESYEVIMDLLGAGTGAL
jgi:hypothetical protein